MISSPSVSPCSIFRACSDDSESVLQLHRWLWRAVCRLKTLWNPRYKLRVSMTLSGEEALSRVAFWSKDPELLRIGDSSSCLKAAIFFLLLDECLFWISFSAILFVSSLCIVHSPPFRDRWCRSGATSNASSLIVVLLFSQWRRRWLKDSFRSCLAVKSAPPSGNCASCRSRWRAWESQTRPRLHQWHTVYLARLPSTW